MVAIENRIEEEEEDKEDVFKVSQSPVLLDDENADSYFMGTSSGRTLIDAFKHKVQETGRACAQIRPEAFFLSETSESSTPQPDGDVQFKAPPRLVSDQLINIFFQEWAPLFPVLHRPTFLTLYGEYVASPETMEDKKSLAQLNLVFAIAAQSSDSRDLAQEIESFEAQWQAALDSFLMDNSLAALQCLVLSQIYCIQKGDYSRLLQYRGLAISVSHRLGLHQSQKRFALGALTSETRKKVFWTLYTLDCFAAAQLGLPTQLKDDDVHCEYPVDADDEYVTEKGFMPTLPGEFTKLSSALALFRAARILAKVLKENYPTAASHEISFRKVAALADDLDAWSNNLPANLRLQFVQDKPSTNVISSRCPILSLTYHYIRSLIYRPVVCCSSTLGDKASLAIVALADSSKHIIQIVELLEERKLSFSFCVSKSELLTLSCFGLLFESLDLDQDGKLIKENQRQINNAVGILERISAPGISELRLISSSIALLVRSDGGRAPTLSRHNSEGNMTAPQDALRATQRQLKAIVSRFTSSARPKHGRNDASSEEISRRATFPALGHHLNQSQVSISSIRSEPTLLPGQSRSEPAMSPLSHRASVPTPTRNPRHKCASVPRQVPNLDYLSFGPEPHGFNTASEHPYPSNISAKTEVSPSDWERLLGSLDNGTTNIYDTIYGGPPPDALTDMPPITAAESQLLWAQHPDGLWNLTGGAYAEAQPPVAQSVLSFSDESLSSGPEDFSLEFPGGPGSVNGSEQYRGILIPELSPSCSSEMGLVGLDGAFGL